MRAILVGFALAAALASSALAQVPVADSAREAKETQTAGCVARAAVSRGATLQPVQGVKGSMVAPSAAAPSAQVGAASVTGLPSTGAAGGASTGLGSFSGSTVGGVDFSNLTAPTATGTPAPTASLGPSSVATVGQAVNGLSSLTAALQSNGPFLNGAGATIGALSAAQAAWSQNTSARIGGVSIWGQAIQVGSLALQLRNLMLLQQTARASGQAQVMTYNAVAAVLVGGARVIADNSVATPAQTPTYAAVAAALTAAQKAAVTSGASLPLWAGVVAPLQDLASATGAPAASQ
jgi:hypothetical protein